MLSNKLEKFDMKDIHSGYVVKFRNGRYALCMRVGAKTLKSGEFKPIKIFARVDDDAQKTGASINDTYVYADSYKGSLYHSYDTQIGIASPYPDFDIVAVYGLIENVVDYLNIADTGPISIKNRPLLWSETKKMTLKEIEKALGHKVEIIAEQKTVHYKNEETCNKCKHQRCGDRPCGGCKLNSSEGCMCFHVVQHKECPYFEEK